MEQKFTIAGRLDGLNEYTKANRTGVYVGAEMKKKNEKAVFWAITKAKLKRVNKYPVTLQIAWYEPNNRRDIDNITFATKFIQDTLVRIGILENDNQKCINKVRHDVSVDKEHPRIEVTILEE